MIVAAGGGPVAVEFLVPRTQPSAIFAHNDAKRKKIMLAALPAITGGGADFPVAKER